MDHQMLQHRFAALTTAHVADACIRARVPVRCASALLRAVVPGSRLAGRVCPARHAGSVDAFLEAFEMAAPGDVLVVDNGGRLDEACVGDLVALEAQAAGVEGMVIWGCIATPLTYGRSGCRSSAWERSPLAPSGSTPARMTRWSPPSSETGQ
jgi:4-hydroxy-4-methyl-2-oxoglutarate aldolase